MYGTGRADRRAERAVAHTGCIDIHQCISLGNQRQHATVDHELS